MTRLPPPANLQGRSLVPLLENPGRRWDHPAVTQLRRGAGPKAVAGYSIRTEKWRYTEWDGGRQGVELYDEVADPGELRNLAADRAHGKTVADLQRRLRRVSQR
jgi:uncharacterized sulfatase